MLCEEQAPVVTTTNIIEELVTTTTTATRIDNNSFLTSSEAFINAMSTTNTLTKGLIAATTSTTTAAVSIIPSQDVIATTTATAAAASAPETATTSALDNITAVTVASTTIRVADAGAMSGMDESKCPIDKENDVCKVDAKLVLILQDSDDIKTKEIAMIKPTINNHNNNNNNSNIRDNNNMYKNNNNNNMHSDVAVSHLMDSKESSALGENTKNRSDNNNAANDNHDDEYDSSIGNSNSNTLEGAINSNQSFSSKVAAFNSATSEQQQQQQSPQTASTITLTGSSGGQATYQFLKSNNWPISNKNLTTTVASVPGVRVSAGGIGEVPQTTDNFLSSLGVDISGLCTMSLNASENNNNNCRESFQLGGDVGQAKIILMCEKDSHPFQTRTISMTPGMEYKVGRLIAKSRAAENNTIFDCKVLSRNHALLWYTAGDQKFWVKDTKSSNGTFINDQKLGNDAAELHFGDIVKFGVEVTENTRKERHGSIIASVKLYLPDGSEAISSDALKGEKLIAHDDVHRLNQFMQEFMQREKNLKSTLLNIQNALDATRKNSGQCWKALIAEDQLLNRIHMYEKKLQFMDKNVPENTLRNEIIQLMEEKNSYQQAAKETLRKVYQERCEAMQVLNKMESAYNQSENECAVLREQVMSSKKCVQELSNQLSLTEAEFNEYKRDVQMQQQDAKEQEDTQITALINTLKERTIECDNLKSAIHNLQLERTTLLEEYENLKALNQLDAVIDDVNISEDCYDFDDNSDLMTQSKINVNGSNAIKLPSYNNKNPHKAKIRKKTKPSVFDLFKNSDLSNNSDVLKAIYNSNDSSDDEPDIDDMHQQDCMPIKSKNLQSVHNILLELEAHINNEQLISEALNSDDKEDKTKDQQDTDINDIWAQKLKTYDLLKNSVALLRDAYNDILATCTQISDSQTVSDEHRPELVNISTSMATLETPMDTHAQEIEVKVTDLNDDVNKDEINKLKSNIAELLEKMQSIQTESSSVCSDMRAECESMRGQLVEMKSEVETLRDEKKALEANLTQLQRLTDIKEAVTPSEGTLTPTTTATATRSSSFEQHMEEECYVDSEAAEREEELIKYKDNYHKLQETNMELRSEINELKANVYSPPRFGLAPMLLRVLLPFGIAAFATLYFYMEAGL